MRPPIATAAVAALAALSGCTVGPNYQRPAITAPASFRGAQTTTPEAASLADTKWFDLFQDSALTGLVNTAIEQNHDLRIAANRVLESREQITIARASEFPLINAAAAFNVIRNSRVGASRFVPAGISLDSSYTTANLPSTWELDLWGRIRRQTEAARAQYFASEDARRGVLTSLISDVSSNYFRLRELDLELQIAQQTKENAESSLRITTARRAQGAASGLDVRQAEQFLYTATSEIPAIENQIGQIENAISALLGTTPGDIPRGKALEEFQVPNDVPPGLPSDLLTRRPDIMQAEHLLIAANANIGVARAQYFPRISLTTTMGGQSRALSSLFTGPARAWTFATPTATMPIFAAGAIRSAIRLTESQKADAVESYRRSIETGFREVSDSLIGYQKIAEQLEQQQLLVNALRDTDRLSRLRYQGGLDSFLQVLDAQRNLFQGELALARLRLQHVLYLVQLYKALGGGWQ